MDLEQTGRLAAGHLLPALAGQSAHGVSVVPPRLIIRESTARA